MGLPTGMASERRQDPADGPTHQDGQDPLRLATVPQRPAGVYFSVLPSSTTVLAAVAQGLEERYTISSPHIR